MTIADVQTLIINQISHLYDSNEASLIARYYVEDLALKEEMIEVIKDELLSDIDQLSQGMPLQYVTGIAHFYGYKYEVNPSVLIPRPETEELVHLVSKHLTQIDKTANNKTLMVLDIGTGSGCITNTLARMHQEHDFVGIDIDQGALKVARRNSVGQNTAFLQHDFLDKHSWTALPSPNIIVSNPPYISTREQQDMHINVLRYEPHLALFVHEDPLIFYKQIVAYAQSLATRPIVYCEINEHLYEETKDVFEAEGFDNVQLHQDMQGKWRMISAR